MDRYEKIAQKVTAQHLENVKTIGPLTERELTRAIRDAIIAENDAIKQYETVVDSTDDERVQEVLQDIANEEKVHVGELQALLKMLLDDEQEFLEEGENEVEEMEIVARVTRRILGQNETFDLDKMTMDVAKFFEDNPNPDDDEFHEWAEGKGYNVHEAESKAYALATLAASFILHGRGLEKKLKAEDVDPKELKLGIEVEMEHTGNKQMAERIALDHLAEIENYYTLLKKMEEDAGVEH